MSTTKNQTLAQQLLSGVLFLAVIVMLGWLSVRYKAEFDWTANKRNTLTQGSVKQLGAMPDPVKFVVFAPAGEARKNFENDIRKYRGEKTNIEVEYIDPSAQPAKVREYNVTFVGEIVVEYQGRREHLRATTEPAITTALQRLAFSGEQWIVFLEGHGERSTAEGESQTSVSKFASALRDKGLKVQGLNLVKTPRIPDNTSVLILASPQSQLLPGEAKIVKEFVDGGGNLLWLADPDFPPGLDELAKALGITWQNGYAIFPDYELIGTGHPGFFAAQEYPQNPVTTGLDQVTLFPLVRSLTWDKASGWNAQPLLQTPEASWLETGDIAKGSVALDDKDIPGPLTIGLTLTREHAPAAAASKDAKDPKDKEADKPRTQRVALIGDADFIANAYLGQLGNQTLGLNLVQWLASRDAQLNIDIPKAPDTTLLLPPWETVLIAGGFMVGMPLLLLGFGITRWIIRRRR